MLRTTLLTSLAAALMLGIGAGVTPAQSIAPVYDQDDYDRAQVDRYLDVEVWTSNSDGEFYDGDNIVIYFRASRDAFVSIYSIDTRGRVNLLFPTYEGEDNFVNGGVTYSLPGNKDKYDLVVSGPEGFENIQVIASRERFPVPSWYKGPELLVKEGEDRDSYMDWVNSNYFVDYGGQRFAYDRAVVYVNEWEQDYFRPVYHPVYPSWTVYGNCYIDYPWGASIYINGIYWGCAPLYIPQIACGWNTITIYDYDGYCWEHDFHVSRYNTVVFNRTIINTSPTVKSKYKEVREVGFRDPVQHGYPDFERRKETIVTSLREKGKISSNPGQGHEGDIDMDSAPKKFVRGSTKIVKTERGYETDASTAIFPEKGGKVGSTSRSHNGGTYESSKGRTATPGSYEPSPIQRRSGGGKSGQPSGNTGSGEVKSSHPRSSGASGSSGNTPVIERRKSSGKTEAPTVQRQSPPERQPKPAEAGDKKESKPAETGGKKESRPETSSAGGSKSKGSDSGKSGGGKSDEGDKSGGKSQGGGKGGGRH